MTRPHLGSDRTNWLRAGASICGWIGICCIVVAIAAAASGMPSGALTLVALAFGFLGAGFVFEAI